MKQKKIPMRMCINCREMKPKRELIRIVKSLDSKLSVDITGKMPGRGAYVCSEEVCVTTAKKLKKIERSFGVSGCENIYEALQERVGGHFDK